MPRKARLDIPGHLYHVIARGNERRAIFRERKDYEDFIARLRAVLMKADARCLSWCLMPNHFHLAILRGSDTLARLMRCLMTGYAVGFNLRHRRCGHLFQNRYKSILCAKDDYLFGLIAYIHLNPLRAGLVKNLDGLSEYPWCGHGAVMGARSPDFLDRDHVLSCFGQTEKEAVVRYSFLLQDSIARQKFGERSGGGFVKDLGGTECALSLNKSAAKELHDDRVLGAPGFVESVLRESEHAVPEILSIEEIRKKVVKEFNVAYGDIASGSRERRVSLARAAYCYLAKEGCHMGGTEISKELGLSSGGLSRLVARGRQLWLQNK